MSDVIQEFFEKQKEAVESTFGCSYIAPEEFLDEAVEEETILLDDEENV